MTIMRSVTAVADDTGGHLELGESPRPTPGPGQVLVRVGATSLNRGALVARRLIAQGRPTAPTATPSGPTGTDFAGVVEELGLGVPEMPIGRRVMGRGRGTFAEFAVVDARALIDVPSGMSIDDAASMPNVFITSHNAITTANLKPGESFLVNAASSGIGTASLQIAKAMGAKPVIGTSRSTAKLDALREFGMDIGIVAGQDFVNEVMVATDGRGVDVLIDTLGASVLDVNLRSMALGGRLVSVGRTDSEETMIDLDYVALRRISLIGVTFRTRDAEETLACSERFVQDLGGALESGQLKPVVDRVFPLEAIHEAESYMTRDQHVGKIVLHVQDLKSSSLSAGA